MPSDTRFLFLSYANLIRCQKYQRLLTVTGKSDIRVVAVRSISVVNVVVTLAKIMEHSYKIGTLSAVPVKFQMFGKMQQALSHFKGMIEQGR